MKFLIVPQVIGRGLQSCGVQNGHSCGVQNGVTISGCGVQNGKTCTARCAINNIH